MRQDAGISLCMIVRNEEAHLDRCLTSVRDLVDQLIVVDTGSTDATRSIAARQRADIIDFPWPESFAVARNESIRPARGHWIFWLDADEFLDEPNRRRFQDLRDTLLASPRSTRVCIMRQDSRTEKGAAAAADQARLFPNIPGLAWQYRVHEQILPSLLERGCAPVATDIVIHHTGYLDPVTRERKLDRNLKLLINDLHDFPGDAFLWFNRASCHLDRREFAEGGACLEKSIDLGNPRAGFIVRAWVLLVLARRRLGQLDLALTACDAGLARHPDHPELLHAKGVVLEKLGRSLDAVQCFELVLAAHTVTPAVGVAPDTLIASAQRRIGAIRERLADEMAK